MASASGQVIVKDRALFRIERKVFFQEAFLGWMKQWNKLSCATNRSWLLRGIGLEAQDFRGVSELLTSLESRQPTTKERQVLERQIKLVKFVLFVQNQKTPSKEKLSWPRGLNCVLGDKKSKVADELKLVAEAENFLRERFTSDKEEGEEARRASDDEFNRTRAYLDSVLRGQNHEIFL